MSSVVLDVKDLHTCYKTRLKEKVYAVEGVSLTLKEGEILGIAGESGCGKSTLALSLMGFYFQPLNFISGQIFVKGVDIMTLTYEKLRREYLGKKIAYIPQSAMNALNPTSKIINFIEDILKSHGVGIGKNEMYEMVRERFETLNLPKRALNCYPNELSGGMKQRIVIAISTILDPEILIADEPTSALDVSCQKMVIKMLFGLMKDKLVKSIIFITHELPLLRHVADNIMVMYAGKIVERGPMKDVIFNPVHPYSKALMGAIIVPEEEMKDLKLSAIPGTPPNLKIRMDGCLFAERCNYVIPRCRSGEIAELKWENQQYKCIFDCKTLMGYYKNE